MDLIFGDHQGRRQPDGRAVRVLGEHMSPRQRLTDFAARSQQRINVNACPQSPGSYGDHPATNHGIQPLPHPQPEPGSSLLVFPCLEQPHDGETQSTGERIAAECAAVLARLQHAQHIMISNDCGYRNDAATKRLAQQVDIGDDALVLAGEGTARTT